MAQDDEQNESEPFYLPHLAEELKTNPEFAAEFDQATRSRWTNGKTPTILRKFARHPRAVVALLRDADQIQREAAKPTKKLRPRK